MAKHNTGKHSDRQRGAELVELVGFDGASFVEAEGRRTVKDVVMLGPVSKHGYTYTQEAIARAVNGKLYEGCRIFINHAEGGRNLMHLAGVFRNVRHEGEKVKGDAHLLDDSYGLKFWSIAKTMPEAASCSHVACGKIAERGGKKYVEEITAVKSVDLVVQGATTSTVFEGQDSDKGGSQMEYSELTIADLRAARPDIAKALIDEGAKSRDEEVKTLIQEKAAAVKSLDDLRVVEATREKDSVVTRLLADLPEQARTEVFKKQCLEVTSGKDGTFDRAVFEAKVTDLVKDRKTLVESAGVRNMGGEKKKTDQAKLDEAKIDAAFNL